MSRKRKQYYVITAEDIDQPIIQAFDRVWLVTGFLDKIQVQDVGKRVYLTKGVPEVESQEQFTKRKPNSLG